MRKLFVIALLFVGVATAQAQTKFGAQFNFTTSSAAQIGIGGHAEIFFNDQWSLQPALDYYFGKDLGGGVTSSVFMINADGHYYFNEDPKIYGIGGLSYWNQSISGSGYVGAAGSGLGVNLGAGAIFGKFFVEAKYNSPLAGLIFTGGIKFGGD
jgi:hypothetical protein